MDKTPPRPMTPLDELVTPHFLYTLKLLLPYVPPSMQRTCAIFLKFFELKRTIELFYGFDENRKKNSSSNILNDLKPYMSPKEREMMEQMEGMMNMMEMMQQMQNVSGASSDGNESASPFDFMKGMMDPEQMQMFDMYNNIFEQTLNSENFNSQEGESDYE